MEQRLCKSFCKFSLRHFSLKPFSGPSLPTPPPPTPKGSKTGSQISIPSLFYDVRKSDLSSSPSPSHPRICPITSYTSLENGHKILLFVSNVSTRMPFIRRIRGALRLEKFEDEFKMPCNFLTPSPYHSLCTHPRPSKGKTFSSKHKLRCNRIFFFHIWNVSNIFAKGYVLLCMSYPLRKNKFSRSNMAPFYEFF